MKAHPKASLTHSQARCAVCVLCWEKSDRLVTRAIGDKIRKFTHHKQFNLTNQSYPAGLCSTCNRNLSRVSSNSLGSRPDPRLKWRQHQLESINIPDDTVPSEQCAHESKCPICSLARFHPVGKTGHKDKVHNPKMDPKGLSDALLQPKVDVKVEPALCHLCYAHMGKGLAHPNCPNSKVGKRKAAQASGEKTDGSQNKTNGKRMRRGEARTRENIQEAIMIQSVGCQETILSGMLMNIDQKNDAGEPMLQLKKPGGGRPLNLSLGKVPEPTEVTPDMMVEIDKALQLSQRERERLVRILRMRGFKMTPYMREILADMDKYLAKWYSVITLEVTETYTVTDDEDTEPSSKKKTKKKKKKCTNPSVPDTAVSSPDSTPWNSPINPETPSTVQESLFQNTVTKSTPSPHCTTNKETAPPALFQTPVQDPTPLNLYSNVNASHNTPAFNTIPSHPPEPDVSYNTPGYGPSTPDNTPTQPTVPLALRNTPSQSRQRYSRSSALTAETKMEQLAPSPRTPQTRAKHHTLPPTPCSGTPFNPRMNLDGFFDSDSDTEQEIPPIPDLSSVHEPVLTHPNPSPTLAFAQIPGPNPGTSKSPAPCPPISAVLPGVRYGSRRESATNAAFTMIQESSPRAQSFIPPSSPMGPPARPSQSPRITPRRPQSTSQRLPAHMYPPEHTSPSESSLGDIEGKENKEKKKKKKTLTRQVFKPVAHVTDVSGFVKMICAEREIPEENVMSRISMDYGKGSFKVTCSTMCTV